MSSKHHSFLIVGTKNKVKAPLLQYINENIGKETVSGADYYEREYETFSIDDARSLRSLITTRPFGDRKVIIIYANFVGTEAQNAILKFLEEPAKGIFIFMVVPSENILLTTVLSRLIKLDILEKDVTENEIISSAEFLKNSAEDRLKILSNFLSHESETKKTDLLNLMNGIERELQSKIANEAVRTSIENLYSVKKYVYDRSPSVKMIAEYLALSFPIIK